MALNRYQLTDNEVSFVFDSLDLDAITKSAIYGNDLDEQANYAHQAILDQANEKQSESVYYDVPLMQTTFTAHTLLEQIHAKRMAAVEVNETIYSTLRQAFDAGHKH